MCMANSPDQKIEIRPACEEDLPRIFALELSAFASPWSYASFEEEFYSSRFSVWPKLYVAYIEDKLVGYIDSHFILDTIYVMSISVDADFKRRGIASELMLTIMAEAKAQGAKLAQLEVRESNTAARALYAKLGFVEVGLRKNYYGDNEHAVLLDKQL